ncbi:putative membrane protein, partial [Vibrio parahaemolyticus V-223/04]
SMF